MHSEKFLRTINEFTSCNVAVFFYSKSTQRGIGHPMGTPRALQRHFRVTPRALKEYLATRGTRGTLFTRLRIYGVKERI